MTGARRESGSVSPLVLFGAVVMAVLGIGGATIGRMVSAKQDAQRAADSAAIAAADLVREEGMQGPVEDSEVLGGRNVRNLPVSWNGVIVEFGDRVVASSYADIDVETPRFVEPEGVATVGTTARARIGQFVQSDVAWQLPRLVLVLDYSGSMAERLNDGQLRLDVLEASIRDILDDGLRIEFGAAFFSSTLLDSVEFGPDALDEIRGALDRLGPDSATCTSCGLAEAYRLLQGQENTGFHVVLVSDGQPNDGGGEAGALHEAERLWYDLDAEIHSLHVGYGGGEPFMRNVAGTPSRHPHPRYFHSAADARELADALREIVASIVCRVGPLPEGAVEDPSTVRVFLRDRASGIETRVEPMNGDPGDNPDALAFDYDPATRQIVMTNAACRVVSEGGDEVVVRFNRARLIQ